MISLEEFYSHQQISAAELLAAAAGWEALAVEQEERLAWDREAPPSMVRSKATLYRSVAAEQRQRAANIAAGLPPSPNARFSPA